jgi:2-polyprenyl-3-methyl-5-hydroxy-6-metoxy-1,4-benzoquinol methylase
MKKSKSNWEYPHCNLCNYKKFDILLRDASSWMSKGKFRIARCRKCGLAYVFPRPKQKDIHKYYEPESYWGFDLTKLTLKDAVKKRDEAYGVLYEEIFNKDERGSILDVGAGTGLFLTKFKEKGWKIRGVELSEEACQYAKKNNQIDLEKGDLLNQAYPNKSFDVVTLNGCLEHLYKPKETLAFINKLLRKGGLVVITVPNFDSIGRRLFGKEWYALQPPTHLYHFTPKTLSSMLKDTGFKINIVNHSYWQHNYHIIFESIRMLLSPKFKKLPEGGLKDKKALVKKSQPTVQLEIGKIMAKLTANLIALFGPILKKGEVITIYAEKD